MHGRRLAFGVPVLAPLVAERLAAALPVRDRRVPDSACPVAGVAPSSRKHCASSGVGADPRSSTVAALPWYEERPNFWVNHLHPGDRDWCVHFCTQETAQGRDHVFEYRMIHRDGREVWLRDRAYVVRDAAGKVSNLRGITAPNLKS